MGRLRKSCRQLIWLNPLLRFDEFEPLATGVRIMLPHVDAFLPAHNVDSLTELASALKRANQAPFRRVSSVAMASHEVEMAFGAPGPTHGDEKSGRYPFTFSKNGLGQSDMTSNGTTASVIQLPSY